MSEPEEKSLGEFRIVVAGESQVGGSSFTDMFHVGHHFPVYNPMEVSGYSRLKADEGGSYGVHMIDVSLTAAREEDSFKPPRYFDTKIQEADGIVLIYDTTNETSFRDLTGISFGRVDASKWDVGLVSDRFQSEYNFVLVGNKADLVEQDPTRRQVDKDKAASWGRARHMRHFEVSSNNRSEVNKVIQELIKDIIWDRKMAAKHAAEDKEKEQKAQTSASQDKKTTPRDSKKIKDKFKDVFGSCGSSQGS